MDSGSSWGLFMTQTKSECGKLSGHTRVSLSTHQMCTHTLLYAYILMQQALMPIGVQGSEPFSQLLGPTEASPNYSHPKCI